nr:MAG TPA_asm: hypothetical protein [Caudoviricetes sp.]
MHSGGNPTAEQSGSSSPVRSSTAPLARSIPTLMTSSTRAGSISAVVRSPPAAPSQKHRNTSTRRTAPQIIIPAKSSGIIRSVICTGIPPPGKTCHQLCRRHRHSQGIHGYYPDARQYLHRALCSAGGAQRGGSRRNKLKARSIQHRQHYHVVAGSSVARGLLLLYRFHRLDSQGCGGITKSQDIRGQVHGDKLHCPATLFQPPEQPGKHRRQERRHQPDCAALLCNLHKSAPEAHYSAQGNGKGDRGARPVKHRGGYLREPSGGYSADDGSSRDYYKEYLQFSAPPDSIWSLKRYKTDVSSLPYLLPIFLTFFQYQTYIYGNPIFGLVKAMKSLYTVCFAIHLTLLYTV